MIFTHLKINESESPPTQRICLVCARVWQCLCLIWVLLAIGCDGEGSVDNTNNGDAGEVNDTDESDTDAGVTDAGDRDASGTDTDEPQLPVPPGSACTCDTDCQGDSLHPGVCIVGVCMTMAEGKCSSAGSSTECAPGSRCWEIADAPGIGICWPSCDAFDCAGECDADNACFVSDSTTCDPTCGALCPADFLPCAADNPGGYCGDPAQICREGSCQTPCSLNALTGYCSPQTTCQAGICISSSGCPDWMCHGPDCEEIVKMPGSFDPNSQQAKDDGYYIAIFERYAYLRRDLTMLIKYATCEVAARFPGTLPLGLSDMTQADGLTPGVDIGFPRHPTLTHTGSDIDLAYYQTDGLNDPQIICGDGSDTNFNSAPGTYNDGYFCTTEQNIIDWPKEAFLFAKMAVTETARVFGIDTTLLDDFESHLNDLSLSGELSPSELKRALQLGTGAALGWQYHHHHTHMSFCPPGTVGPYCAGLLINNFPDSSDEITDYKYPSASIIPPLVNYPSIPSIQHPVPPK